MGAELEEVCAFSVGNDNCIANKEFMRLLEACEQGYLSLSVGDCAKSANSGLIQNFQELLKLVTAGYLMVGSNRQDNATDSSNAFNKKNGSFLPLIRAVHQDIVKNPYCAHLKLDRYLLADGLQRGGTQFDLMEKFQAVKLALAKLQSEQLLNNKKANEKQIEKLTAELDKIKAKLTRWILDNSNFSISYAQIHRIASKHPKAKIQFHVIEGSEEILTGQEIYVAPALPETVLNADDKEHETKEQLIYKLRNKIIFTPQGLYVYQQEGPLTPWAFKRIVGLNDAKAPALAPYFAAAAAATGVKAIKQDLSEAEIDQLDNVLDEVGARNVSGLKGLFTKFKELLPENVTLYLHRYDGNKFVRNVGVVKGTGNIDYDYKKTILPMARALTGVEDENTAAPCEYDIGDLYRKYRFGEEMKVQQIETFKNTARYVYKKNKSLKSAICELSNLLHTNFNAQFKKSDMRREDVLTSPAGNIFFELEALKKSLYSHEKQLGEKLADIQAFENACCKKEPGYKIFLKSIAILISAAVGFAIGAAIGFGIGYLAGAWSGPLAAATAVAGLVKGSITGKAIGLAIGTALTGVGAATATGILLFKQDPLTKAARHVVEVAREDKMLKPAVKIL